MATNRNRRTKSNWLERNANLVASFLTFITILITIYFSSASFNLANKQYHDLIDQRRIDSFKNSREQAKNTQIHIQDSIRIAKQDSEQRVRWTEQNAINKQQLIAFKSQAEIAKLQFENQRATYIAQRELDRPNLLFAAVNIDTLPNAKSLSRIILINSGKMNTTVKRIVVFGWNFATNNWTSGDFPDDIEATGVTSISVDLNLPSSFIINSNTIYYLRIYYIDFNGRVVPKDIFKRVDMAYFPKISLSTIPDQLQTAFMDFLKGKVKNIEQVLNEPDNGVAIQFR